MFFLAITSLHVTSTVLPDCFQAKSQSPPFLWGENSSGEGCGLAAEQGEQHSGRDRRADYSGDVGAHGVHEQEIARVFLLADGL